MNAPKRHFDSGYALGIIIFVCIKVLWTMCISYLVKNWVPEWMSLFEEDSMCVMVTTSRHGCAPMFAGYDYMFTATKSQFSQELHVASTLLQCMGECYRVVLIECKKAIQYIHETFDWSIRIWLLQCKDVAAICQMNKMNNKLGLSCATYSMGKVKDLFSWEWFINYLVSQHQF